MIKKLEQYFVLEKANICIWSIVCICNIFCLSEILSLQTMISNISGILTIIGVSIFSIISWVFIKKYKKKTIYYGDVKDSFKLEREYYLDRINNMNGFIFLFGESGSGKSYILQKLEKIVRKNVNGKLLVL